MSRPPFKVDHPTQEIEFLATTLRDLVQEQRLTHSELGRRIGYSRSTISRALNGRDIPSESLVARIMTACGEDSLLASTLHAAAINKRRQLRKLRLAGYPPPILSDSTSFIRELKNLVERSGLSHREIVGRDESGTLHRATLGAILRHERPAHRDFILALMQALGLTEGATREWIAAWDLLFSQKSRQRYRTRAPRGGVKRD